MKKMSKGFSLVEMLVASTIVLFILGLIYMSITTTQTMHLTESRKLDMNQAARSLETVLTDSIRSSGSVLSLLPTPPFLGPRPAVAFTGIYPLNNRTYPDGIIIASGDPYAVTELDAAFSPPNAPLSVKTTLDESGNYAWKNGDIGMVCRDDGYYIFKVQESGTGSISSTSLPIRPQGSGGAIYYSGLLNIPGKYNDYTDEQNGGTKGQTGTYPIGCPVIKLTYFNLFLVRTEKDGTKTLTLTTDCEDKADIFSVAPTSRRAVTIVSNIEDIQFEYVSKDDPPELWASIDTSSGMTTHNDPCGVGGECPEFYTQFRNKNIAAVRIYVLFKTEEEKNKRAGSGIFYKKPVMGDAQEKTLAKSRFHYTYMRYEINLRNFAIDF